jgi:hypothetical protein
MTTDHATSETAAVDAVLALHVPSDRHVRQFCDVHAAGNRFRRSWERAVNSCPDCQEVTKRVCAACDPVCAAVAWPCPTALAVRKALGTGGGDHA